MLKQKNIELKQENGSLKEDKQDLKQDKQILRREIEVVKQKRKMLEKMYELLKRENEDIKQKNQDIEQKQIVEHELKEILKKAKLELSPEVKEAYRKLGSLHGDGKEVSSEEHSKALKELLKHLSPETLKEYEEYGTEFVLVSNKELAYPVVAAKSDSSKEWEIQLPFPYTRQRICGMILRTIDLLLEIEQRRTGDIPSPKRRAEIAIRCFKANFKLGQGTCAGFGFAIADYELAKKYYKDYKDGIRRAFKDRQISKADQRDKFIEIGQKHADTEYLKSIIPPEGVPCVFPSMQPGARFEDFRMLRSEQQQPVKLGSPEFAKVREELKRRQKKGENSKLTVTVLPNREIWVQPYFIEKGLASRHPTTAFGNHCAWAGEADIDFRDEAKDVLLSLKDQSGHYRTFDKNDPGCLIDFAVQLFQDHGCDTSNTMLMLTAIEHEHFERVEYDNYKLRTRDDLKNSGGLTESEVHILKFQQGQAKPSQLAEWCAPGAEIIQEKTASTSHK
jgi:hypothetical protein